LTNWVSSQESLTKCVCQYNTYTERVVYVLFSLVLFLFLFIEFLISGNVKKKNERIVKKAEFEFKRRIRTEGVLGKSS